MYKLWKKDVLAHADKASNIRYGKTGNERNFWNGLVEKVMTMYG